MKEIQSEQLREDKRLNLREVDTCSKEKLLIKYDGNRKIKEFSNVKLRGTSLFKNKKKIYIIIVIIIITSAICLRRQINRFNFNYERQRTISSESITDNEKINLSINN